MSKSNGDPTRETAVRERILKALDAADPNALPEYEVLDAINRGLRPQAGKAEFDDAMNWLVIKGLIRSKPSTLDEAVTCWYLTDAGENALKKI